MYVNPLFKLLISLSTYINHGITKLTKHVTCFLSNTYTDIPEESTAFMLRVGNHKLIMNSHDNVKSYYVITKGYINKWLVRSNREL